MVPLLPPGGFLAAAGGREVTAGEQRLPHRGVAEDARQAQLTRCLRHLNMLAPLFKKTRVPGKKQIREKHMETGESLYLFYKQ